MFLESIHNVDFNLFFFARIQGNNKNKERKNKKNEIKCFIINLNKKVLSNVKLRFLAFYLSIFGLNENCMRKALMAQFYNYVNAFVGKCEYSVVSSFTRFNILSLEIFINKWVEIVFTIVYLPFGIFIRIFTYFSTLFHSLSKLKFFVNEIYSIIIRREIFFFLLLNKA